MEVLLYYFHNRLSVCQWDYTNTNGWNFMQKEIRGRVLVQVRSHYILRAIWITVWTQKKIIQIFPFTCYYMLCRRSALSEGFCYYYNVLILPNLLL